MGNEATHSLITHDTVMARLAHLPRSSLATPSLFSRRLLDLTAVRDASTCVSGADEPHITPSRTRRRPPWPSLRLARNHDVNLLPFLVRQRGVVHLPRGGGRRYDVALAQCTRARTRTRLALGATAEGESTVCSDE